MLPRDFLLVHARFPNHLGDGVAKCFWGVHKHKLPSAFLHVCWPYLLLAGAGAYVEGLASAALLIRLLPADYAVLRRFHRILLATRCLLPGHALLAGTFRLLFRYLGAQALRDFRGDERNIPSHVLVQEFVPLQVGVPAAITAVAHEAEGAFLETLPVFLSTHNTIQHVKMHLGARGVRFK